jgi:predicted RNA-binding Zn-ribbon protein involved in translation (DUF1610 family)
MFINEDFRCDSCLVVFEQLVDKELRDEKQECPECGERIAYRTIATPRSLVQKAAYVMGTRRQGLQDYKESLDLEIKAADTPPLSSERAGLAKEIRRLRSVK